MESTQTFRVFQAENGKAYELNIRNRESVERLKELLTQASGIPPEQQILLTMQGAMLESNKALSNYENDHLFLFYRRTFTSERPPEERQPVTLEVPARERIQVPSHLCIENNPVSHYAQQFYKQFKIAEAIVRTADNRLSSCERSKEEYRVQLNAIEAATNNLLMHEGNIRQKLTSYKNKFEKANTKHEEILDSFDNDIQVLKKIKLHDSLLSESRTTLYDCIPETQIRNWAHKLERENTKLKTKTQELDSSSTRLSKEIQKSNLGRPIGQFQYLESHLNHIRELLQRQYQLYHNIQQDVNSIVGLLSSPQTADLSRLKQLLEEHETILREMNTNDEQMRYNLSQVYDSKGQLCQQLFAYLRDISKFQSHIRKIGRRIAMYSEVIKKHNEHFRHLELVHYLPETYIRCLEEVVRRRGYRRQFITETRRLAERLNKLREDEVLKREQFKRRYGSLIPQNLVPGLDEKPPSYTPSTPNFDSSLPQIDSLQEIEQNTLDYLQELVPSLKNLDTAPEHDNALFEQINDIFYHETTDSDMDSSREIESLTEKLSQMKEEHSEAQRKIKEMEERISEKNNIEASMNSKNKELSSQIKDLQQRLDSCSSPMSTSDSSESASFNMDSSQILKEKHAKVKHELESIKAETRKYQSWYEIATQESEGMREELRILRSQLDLTQENEQQLRNQLFTTQESEQRLRRLVERQEAIQSSSSKSRDSSQYQITESLDSNDDSFSSGEFKSRSQEGDEIQSLMTQIQELRENNNRLDGLVAMKEKLRSEAIQNCAHSERKLKDLSQYLETTNRNFSIILDILIEFSHERLPVVHDLLKQVKNSNNTSVQTKISAQDVEPLRELLNQLIKLEKNEINVAIKDIQQNQIAVAVYELEKDIWRLLTMDQEYSYLISESSESILNSRQDQMIAFVKVLHINNNTESGHDSKRGSFNFSHVVEVEPHTF